MAEVYLVHCVDTEGPLSEAPPSWRGEPDPVFERVDLDEEAPDFDALTQRHRPQVLGSWGQVAAMLQGATAPEERLRLPDALGRGWRFNWFCMDHVGFEENPRFRAMGVHQVFDFYQAMVAEQKAGDSLHWHFHPEPIYGDGSKCAISYQNSPSLLRLLCRRLIERGWFPSANRSGFNTQRPDSHWFMDQWVPFDFSNMATSDLDTTANPDLADGRFGDWRRAPADWSPYRPSPLDYQRPGEGRRWMARCQNMLNRFASLSMAEVDLAFDHAADGQAVVLGLVSHDWRDLRVEMDAARWMLKRAAARRPEVRFYYCDAAEAFARAGLTESAPPAVQLRCTAHLDKRGRPRRLDVLVETGGLFGAQPFLALETRSKLFRHEPFDVPENGRKYSFVFDDQSVRPDDVAAIGVATNDAAGRQSVHIWRVDDAAPGAGEVVF